MTLGAVTLTPNKVCTSLNILQHSLTWKITQNCGRIVDFSKCCKYNIFTVFSLVGIFHQMLLLLDESPSHWFCGQLFWCVYMWHCCLWRQVPDGDAMTYRRATVRGKHTLYNGLTFSQAWPQIHLRKFQERRIMNFHIQGRTILLCACKKIPLMCSGTQTAPHFMCGRNL